MTLIQTEQLTKIYGSGEADVRWLDMVDARIDDVERQPLPEPEAKPRGRPNKQ